MRVAFIGNRGDSDTGAVGRVLVGKGAATETWCREDPGSWPGLDGVDLLVPLGSDWSVYWPDRSGWVAAEADLVGRATSQGRPVFAICYGAQLLAHSLGGVVEPAPRAEIGWYRIDSDEPALEEGPWAQWHSDRFSVPEGARELARSEVGPQAFVAGRSLGVQFHPEAGTEILMRWAEGEGARAVERVGGTGAALAEESDRQAEANERRTSRLLEWFLGR